MGVAEGGEWPQCADLSFTDNFRHQFSQAFSLRACEKDTGKFNVELNIGIQPRNKDILDCFGSDCDYGTILLLQNLK